MEINVWLALSMLPGVLSTFHPVTTITITTATTTVTLIVILITIIITSTTTVITIMKENELWTLPKSLVNRGLARRKDSLLTLGSSGHSLTGPSVAAGAENTAQLGWIPPWLSGGGVLCWTFAPRVGCPSLCPPCPPTSLYSLDSLL